MFKTKTKFKSGFTLVELLVTLGIMMLLMGITMPFEISYRNKAEIKKSVKELRSLFWEAQNRSLAPRSVDVTGYKINLNKNQGTLSKISLKECAGLGAEMVCNDIAGAQTPQVILGKNITIENISFVDGSADVLGLVSTSFAVGNNSGSGQISFNQPGDKMIIKIGSKLTTLKYDIIIDKKMGSITYSTITP